MLISLYRLNPNHINFLYSFSLLFQFKAGQLFQTDEHNWAEKYGTHDNKTECERKMSCCIFSKIKWPAKVTNPIRGGLHSYNVLEFIRGCYLNSKLNGCGKTTTEKMGLSCCGRLCESLLLILIKMPACEDTISLRLLVSVLENAKHVVKCFQWLF